MNAVARLLGMTRTHFSTFDGLPWPTPYSNYSTAANLLTLGRAAMQSAVFRSIVGQRSYRITAGSGHHAYLWRNLNPLLGHYPGVIGIKPGYTGAAGQCLLFEATRNGYSVIGVTLHSPGSINALNRADATRILNWASAFVSARIRGRGDVAVAPPLAVGCNDRTDRSVYSGPTLKVET